MYYQDENGQFQEIMLEPSGDTVPIGSIAQFGGELAPTNWLFCNGQAISRTNYAELFEAIGTTYGAGDGSTTFNVPDFRSRSPMGIGEGTDGTNTETTTLGQAKGEYKHTLTVNELAKHSHDVTKEGHPARQAGFVYNSGDARFAIVDAGYVIENPGTAGGNQAHNTMHPVLGVNFIIKAKQSIGVVGTVTEDINDTNKDAVPNAKSVKDYVDNKNIYSTDEIVVGTWMGKPLYRKVGTGKFPVIASGATEHVTLLTLSNVDKIIKVEGFINVRGGDFQQGIGGYFNDTQRSLVQFTKSSGNLSVYGGPNYSEQEIWASAEYTKTTDEAAV